MEALIDRFDIQMSIRDACLAKERIREETLHRKINKIIDKNSSFANMDTVQRLLQIVLL